MIRTISDAQSALTPVFDRYGISRAVLFGSVAKGTATQKSDLDILVDSKLRGLKFVGVMEAGRPWGCLWMCSTCLTLNMVR